MKLWMLPFMFLTFFFLGLYSGSYFAEIKLANQCHDKREFTLVGFLYEDGVRYKCEYIIPKGAKNG